MNFIRTHQYCVWLLVLLFVAPRRVSAQYSSTVLPLQPEKLAYAREVEQEAITKKDSLLFAEAYYLYGKIYVAARDYLQAKNYYLKSFKIAERYKRFDKIGRLYLRMTELEIELSNGEKALEYARMALFYKRKGPKREITSAYEAISIAYGFICQDRLVVKGEHPLQDSLFYYCNLTERLAYEHRDTLVMAAISKQLGNIYQWKQNPKAFKYYQTALNLYKIIDRKIPQVHILQQMILTHLRFNQPDKAYLLLQEAERIYNGLQIRVFYIEKVFTETYLSYYQQKRDWQKAFEQSQRARSNDYDQMMADRDGAVSRLSIEFDSEKQKAQLASQQKELHLSLRNQRTQLWLLALLLVLLVGTVGASVVFYRISRKNDRLNRQNKTLVQEQNHRVKNNLQLISSLLSLQSNQLGDEAAKRAVEDSQRRIEVMGLLQRKLYDGDDHASVHVADFIQELTEMVLQTFELDSVETIYRIPGTISLPTDQIMRIGLIINELITNACKYAFAEQPDPSLQIEAYIHKGTFALRVADNGKGINSPPLLSKAFGVRLIQIQVEQLFGNYKFENRSGTIFAMTFPLLAPLIK